jgi:adenine-specific DNA-methyltransferase
MPRGFRLVPTPLPGLEVAPAVLTSAPTNRELSDDTWRPAVGPLRVSDSFHREADAVLFTGRCQELLDLMPAESVQLVVTSPPYNIGKSYEKRVSLDEYLQDQAEVIDKAVRVLRPEGSICWQVGNHVYEGQVFPLDILLYPIFMSHGLQLRNRIIWRFGHGLHATRRLSGRYETILWFTKTGDYWFDIDPIRVPQKYPNKRAFKGPNIGNLTGNPLGKNPSDVWDIPNVKSNHVEKTIHPCQFPVELVERLVLSMTRFGDTVLDPYGGVGSSVIAAVLNGRIGVMAEISPEYVETARWRLHLAESGGLRTRPMDRAVYDPSSADPSRIS